MPNVPKRPCRECGVQVIDRKVCQPGRGCKKRQTAPLTQTVSPAPQAPATTMPVEPKLVNRIAILLDASSSIQDSGLTSSIIKYYNEQIGAIKQKAYETKQATYISVYAFGGVDPNRRRYQSVGCMFQGNERVKTLQKDAWYEQALFLTPENFKPYGDTPMIDCIIQAIDDLSFHQPDDLHDLSYLVMVMTDGMENDSQSFRKNNIKGIIEEKIGTDRWTFTYAGPDSAKYQLNRYGISTGNFLAWDQTVAGVDEMSQTVKGSTLNYMAARSVGVRSTKEFFSTNLTGIDPTAIKSLSNQNNKFRRLAVTEDIPISDFMNRQIGAAYQISRGFYELTKPEDVQPHKEMVIVSKTTGQIYGGNDARGLLKLPTDREFRVRPGDHGDYKVFIQSTSMNRKLIQDTEFLYRDV